MCLQSREGEFVIKKSVCVCEGEKERDEGKGIYD